VTQVRPGETVLLDAGSTVGALANALRAVPNLTVVTVGLTALQELSDAEEVTVHCLGGTLRPLSQGFVGPLTEAALERVTFDRAFLGADGVTADGLCEADLVQTRLKELMARRATDVYVLAHGAKLERRPFHAWARLEPGWMLITDASAEPAKVERLRGAGITVVVAGATEDVESA
jgi:DeoR/GlpR family transcriptional regulator of sugar metabolism